LAINKDDIMEAALDLLNENGLEGLSMRKIATKLGVSAPTLYFHVKDKNDLYSLLAEKICENILNKTKDDATLEELCYSAYNEYRKIPSVCQIFQQTETNGGARLELTCRFLDHLSEMGVRKPHLEPAASLLNNFILSCVADDQKDPDKKEPSDALEAYRFMYGLDVIMKGIRQVK
jgi:TetR/AcrR family tetracycline transcriptional repressor